MWEIKLKEKPEDRAFLTIWDNNFEERAIVELDNWNYCTDNIYEENKTRTDLLFRKKNDTLNALSSAQGRNNISGIEMAKYKRDFRR